MKIHIESISKSHNISTRRLKVKYIFIVRRVIVMMIVLTFALVYDRLTKTSGTFLQDFLEILKRTLQKFQKILKKVFLRGTHFLRRITGVWLIWTC